MKQKISTLEFIRLYSMTYYGYLRNKEINILSEKEENELYWILKGMMLNYSMENFTVDREENHIKYKFYNELSRNTITIFQFPKNIWKEKFIIETENYKETIEREYF